MKKTVSINIAGQLFRVDEDAYEILKRYLDHVSARFNREQGGEETLSDIESRIAEIFGGGKEPPTLVSKEMVQEMINIMGAPEDYYDEATAVNGGSSYTRKELYDPNSFSARTGKALSEFFKALGRFLSVVWRVLAIIIGSFFAVFGMIMLSLTVLLFFFHNRPFLTDVIQPDITNLHSLLSIVMHGNIVIPVLILSGIVLIIPLAALVYVGVKMIFNIRERSRVLNLVVFLVWLASACMLAVILPLQLVVYANKSNTEERIMVSDPPSTLWIAPGKKVASLKYDEETTVDNFRFYRDIFNDRLYCSANLNINSSDTTVMWISVEKISHSNESREAILNSRAIEYSWKYSGDTLYLDEYFSLPAGKRWNGSEVDIDLSVPNGTEIRFVPEADHIIWMFWEHNPDAQAFRVIGWDDAETGHGWDIEEIEK